MKENFKHIESPLEKIQKLNGYTFDWKDKVKELGFTPDLDKNDVGLIAQEVQEVVPQAVVPLHLIYYGTMITIKMFQSLEKII